MGYNEWGFFKKLRFRLGWKWGLFVYRFSAIITHDKAYYNKDYQFDFDYYLWSMRSLFDSCRKYESPDTLDWKPGRWRTYLDTLEKSYFSDFANLKPKAYTYYNHVSMYGMIENAHIYQFYVETNNERGRDAAMWLDIMYGSMMDRYSEKQ